MSDQLGKRIALMEYSCSPPQHQAHIPIVKRSGRLLHVTDLGKSLIADLGHLKDILPVLEPVERAPAKAPGLIGQKHRPAVPEVPQVGLSFAHGKVSSELNLTLNGTGPLSGT